MPCGTGGVFYTLPCASLLGSRSPACLPLPCLFCQILMCTNFALMKRMGKAYTAVVQEMQQYNTPDPAPHSPGTYPPPIWIGDVAAAPAGAGVQTHTNWGPMPPPGSYPAPPTNLPTATCLSTRRRLQLPVCPTSARTLHGLPLAHRPLHRAQLAHRQQLALPTVSEEAGQAFNAGASCGAVRVLSVQDSVAVWPQLWLCLEGTCCHKSLPTRPPFCQCVKDVCGQFQSVALFSYVQGGCSAATGMPVCAACLHSCPTGTLLLLPMPCLQLPSVLVGCLRTFRGSQEVVQTWCRRVCMLLGMR